jgi:hypothetical protein
MRFRPCDSHRAARAGPGLRRPRSQRRLQWGCPSESESSLGRLPFGSLERANERVRPDGAARTGDDELAGAQLAPDDRRGVDGERVAVDRAAGELAPLADRLKRVARMPPCRPAGRR